MNWILILLKNILDRIYRIIRIILLSFLIFSPPGHRPYGPVAGKWPRQKNPADPACPAESGIDTACPACPVAPADGTGVAPADGTGLDFRQKGAKRI